MAEIYSSESASLQPNAGQLIKGSSDSDIAVTDKPVRSDCDSPSCEIVSSRQSNVTSEGPDSRSSRVTSGLTDLERSRSDSEFESVAGDNVRVVVRVRPLNSTEEQRCDKNIIKLPGEGAVWIDNSYGQIKPFTFNEAFGEKTSQSQLFQDCGIKNLIDMALEGYSCTCFAFGQTGSGKTHTITGPIKLDYTDDETEILPPSDLQGLIERSFCYLFEQIENRAEAITYTVRASYLEVYNERVKDLLNPSSTHDSLPVRWSSQRGFYVENLFYVECDTVDDLMAVLEEGLRFRHVGSHAVNDYSSRSHSMLTLYVDSEMVDSDDETGFPIVKHGKLSLVDLAGSERVKETKSAGGTFAESQNINKSLLTLGNCISALSDPKKKPGGHVPYRDSKLTKLLADSLGGNGVTLMIACISPGSYVVQDTLNTLRYASRAKKIKNKPVVQMDPKEKLIISLKREIKLLRTENSYFRSQLGISGSGSESQMTIASITTEDEVDENVTPSIEENHPPPSQKDQDPRKHSLVPLPRASGDQSRLTTASNPSASSGLYDMLQEYMTENECLRHENAELLHSREEVSRQQMVISRENERLVKKLEELERVFTSSPLTISEASSSAGDHTQILTTGHQSSMSEPAPNFRAHKSQPESRVQRSNSLPGERKPRSTSGPPTIDRGISLPVINDGPYLNFVSQSTLDEEQGEGSRTPTQSASGVSTPSTVTSTPKPVSPHHQTSNKKSTPLKVRKKMTVMEPKPVKPAGISSYAVQFAKQKEKKAKEQQSKKDTAEQSNELFLPGPASQAGHPAYNHGAGQVPGANMRHDPRYWGYSDSSSTYSQQYGSPYWGHLVNPSSYHPQDLQHYHGSYPGTVPEADHRQPNYYHSSQHKSASGYPPAAKSERLKQELNVLDSQINYYNQMNRPSNKTNTQNPLYHPPR